MDAFREHTGIAALLDRSDVDTDQIIPKQFLKKIERTGFGRHLFHDWRFLDEEGSRPNPDFVLNARRYQNASILVARDNFGCGSSREHAPWALLDYGFRVIVAPSYADIFFNNCFKNGILPVVLTGAEVQRIFDVVEPLEGAQLSVDLQRQSIRLPDGEEVQFDINPFRKECLLNGWDEIGLTMRREEEILRFEKRYREKRPYHFSGLSGG